jgi:hypothetical protein
MWARSLTRGQTVVYSCCWPTPAQSFSGPSPVGLATVFYCLGFETSLLTLLQTALCYVTSREANKDHQYCVCLPCARYHVLIRGNTLIPVFITAIHVLTIRCLATVYSALPRERSHWSPAQQIAAEDSLSLAAIRDSRTDSSTELVV